MSLLVSADIIDCSAFNVADGQIRLYVSGGSVPYEYLWSTGATTSSVIVGSGVYSVTVNDTNSHTSTQTYTVSQPLVFNTDVSALYQNYSYLSDTISRDIYNRTTTSEGFHTVGRSNASHLYSLKKSASTYGNTSSFVGSFEETGIGRMTFNAFDASNVSKEVLYYNVDGVVINGNLTISGSTTQVTVADIIVQDKTITLSSNFGSASQIDGSGIIIGNDTFNRTLLYNYTTDSFDITAGISTTNLRVGSSTLTSNTFSISNPAGGIVLNDSGLYLTNATFVDPIQTTNHVVVDTGLKYRITGKVFGWNGTEWATTDSIRASYFSVNNGPTLSTSGITIPIPSSADTVSINSTGMGIGSFATLTNEGLDLIDTTSAIFFGNKSWRIVYDSLDNALSFDKKVGNAWVTKLFLD